MAIGKLGSRRWLAPEVVQTSAMDCGPATLKSLLEGFHIPVSYGRLREACQTDVDGTSINTLEELAIQLGLEAEQVMIPADHLLITPNETLPAIVVVRLANRLTHFVVVWRRHGHIVQIMDPATGRRWPSCRKFLDDLYIHSFQVPASDWLEWASSDEFLTPLEKRLHQLGISPVQQSQMIDHAVHAAHWSSLATLDAAVRLAQKLVRTGGLPSGRAAAYSVGQLVDTALAQERDQTRVIPEAYWSVLPVLNEDAETEQVTLRGAVMIRVRGQRAAPLTARSQDDSADRATLPPELTAALEETPPKPLREFAKLLFADGRLGPAALLSGMIGLTVGVVLEALLFRGLLDVWRLLGGVDQRLWAIAAVLLFLGLLAILDVVLAKGVFRLGRRLEGRLRMALLEKIPRLGDRYFKSRPTSDMAHRLHAIHHLRSLPKSGRMFVEIVTEIGLTGLGLIWLNPASAPIVLMLMGLTLGLPFLAQPLIAERDLRVRTHNGALSQLHLDALLGIMAVRYHRAHRAIRHEHDALLAEWRRASVALFQVVVGLKGLQVAVGVGGTIWLAYHYLVTANTTSGLLLLIYWALKLHVLSMSLGFVLRNYPAHRNMTLRLLEPLGALEDEAGVGHPAQSAGLNPQDEAAPGFDIAFDNVSVRVGGHLVLRDLTLKMKPGDHIAVVGSSGAGKSSLVAALLGWYRPSVGDIHIDGKPFHGSMIDQVRQATVWVDPSVQLWNRTLVDNLHYGMADTHAVPFRDAVEQANLRFVIDKLPQGLHTLLGEGGGLGVRWRGSARALRACAAAARCAARDSR
ncbi:cysteine peptidase family C39 domain-containing protein [Candidatus Entotheonella palauensis]|uniref:cysteine peptidase family C39 domain-containing protein n=1 Tax=Candidatus Entotheonella palauensis TaxID=93172 RepID=UPI000B7FAB5F|nr:cysteine peptidase family C39 domain-containing protein [Candidatus Entotheonella palauensis]